VFARHLRLFILPRQEIMRAESSSSNWGDEEEGAYEEELVMQPSETIAEDGIKTTVEYGTDEKGQRIKITKKMKLDKHKVNTKILERKKWKKFGETEGVTSNYTNDEVPLELIRPSSKKGPRLTENDFITPDLLCRTCGILGHHWTHRCPYKDRDQIKAREPFAEEEGTEVLTKKGERYVIPVHRGRGTEPERPDLRASRQSEIATIRVTNLSEDIKERDLGELFGPYGRISRIYLAIDKITGQSKGFAFINFYHREDAARAMKGLEGKGVDHLILHLEWARPSSS